MGARGLPAFGGVDASLTTLDKARLVFIPVPYDRTASYMKGTAGGPRAILDASTHMELYDEEIGVEPYTIGIHTAASSPSIRA